MQKVDFKMSVQEVIDLIRLDYFDWIKWIGSELSIRRACQIKYSSLFPDNSSRVIRLSGIIF